MEVSQLRVQSNLTLISAKDIEAAVKRGIEWSWQARNKDGGFGGRPSFGFSVPNDTAEILSGIFQAGRYGFDGGNPKSKTAQPSLNFLRKVAQKYPEGTFNETAKTYLWTARVLYLAEERPDSSLIRHIFQEFSTFRNDGEGWSNSIKGWTHTHNTALGVYVLFLMKKVNREVEESVKYLKTTQNKDGGWGWFKGYLSDSVCTSDAIVALSEFEGGEKAVERGVKWLKATQQYREGYEGRWVPVPEFSQETTVASSSYMHFSTPYAIFALIKAGVKPSDKSIQDGLKYMLTLQGKNGGWPFTSGFYWFPCEMLPITWATGNALWCLSTVWNAMEKN